MQQPGANGVPQDGYGQWDQQAGQNGYQQAPGMVGAGAISKGESGQYAYDEATGHWIDPATGYWYNPDTSEWYWPGGAAAASGSDGAAVQSTDGYQEQDLFAPPTDKQAPVEQQQPVETYQQNQYPPEAQQNQYPPVSQQGQYPPVSQQNYQEPYIPPTSQPESSGAPYTPQQDQYPPPASQGNYEASHGSQYKSAPENYGSSQPVADNHDASQPANPTLQQLVSGVVDPEQGGGFSAFYNHDDGATDDPSAENVTSGTDTSDSSSCPNTSSSLQVDGDTSDSHVEELGQDPEAYGYSKSGSEYQGSVPVSSGEQLSSEGFSEQSISLPTSGEPSSEAVADRSDSSSDQPQKGMFVVGTGTNTPTESTSTLVPTTVSGPEISGDGKTEPVVTEPVSAGTSSWGLPPQVSAPLSNINPPPPPMHSFAPPPASMSGPPLMPPAVTSLAQQVSGMSRESSVGSLGSATFDPATTAPQPKPPTSDQSGSLNVSMMEKSALDSSLNSSTGGDQQISPAGIASKPSVSRPPPGPPPGSFPPGPPPPGGIPNSGNPFRRDPKASSEPPVGPGTGGAAQQQGSAFHRTGASVSGQPGVVPPGASQQPGAALFYHTHSAFKPVVPQEGVAVAAVKMDEAAASSRPQSRASILIHSQHPALKNLQQYRQGNNPTPSMSLLDAPTLSSASNLLLAPAASTSFKPTTTAGLGLSQASAGPTSSTLGPAAAPINLSAIQHQLQEQQQNPVLSPAQPARDPQRGPGEDWLYSDADRQRNRRRRDNRDRDGDYGDRDYHDRDRDRRRDDRDNRDRDRWSRQASYPEEMNRYNKSSSRPSSRASDRDWNEDGRRPRSHSSMSDYDNGGRGQRGYEDDYEDYENRRKYEEQKRFYDEYYKYTGGGAAAGSYGGGGGGYNRRYGGYDDYYRRDGRSGSTSSQGPPSRGQTPSFDHESNSRPSSRASTTSNHSTSSVQENTRYRAQSRERRRPDSRQGLRGAPDPSRTIAYYEQYAQYYQDYYRYYYGKDWPGYEDYMAQARALLADSNEPEKPPPRRTPVQFSMPHTCIRFGPGGVLIRVKPHAPKEGQPAQVQMINAASLIADKTEVNELATFPGPLIKGETHKNDVLQFCQQQAKKAATDTSLADPESAAMLWRYMELLVKQNGVTAGTDISELLLDGHLPSSSDIANTGVSIPGSEDVQKTGESDAELTDRFRQLLLYGQKKDALEWAMRNGLWGHALFLASKMDTRTHASVMTRFANTSMKMNDPLQSLYQLMSGWQPAATTALSDEKWGDWRPHLAMMLSNPSQRPDLDAKAKVTLADTLAGKGLLHASHFCYVIGGVAFGSFLNKSEKLVLLGTPHSRPFEEFSTNLAIQLTETFEYATSLGLPSFFIPAFQSFKVLYATRLAEAGMGLEALRYCEIASKSVNQQPGLFSVGFLEILVQLSEQLQYLDPEKQYTGEAYGESPWITQLKASLAGRQDGSIAAVSASQYVAPAPDPGLYTQQYTDTASQPYAGSGYGQQQQQPDYQTYGGAQQQQEYSQPQGDQSQQGYTTQEGYSQQDYSASQQYQPQEGNAWGGHQAGAGAEASSSAVSSEPPPPPAADSAPAEGGVSSTGEQQQPQTSALSYYNPAAYNSGAQQTTHQADPSWGQDNGNQQPPAWDQSQWPPQQQYGVTAPEDTSQQPPSGVDAIDSPSAASQASGGDYFEQAERQARQRQLSSASTTSQGSTGAPARRQKWPGESDDEGVPAAVKSPNKQEKDKSGGGGGFFGFFSKLTGGRKKDGPAEMKLPDDKNPSIVWDKEKNKWVSVDGSEDMDTAPPPPPPKDGDVMGGPPSMPAAPAAAAVPTSSLGAAPAAFAPSPAPGVNKFSRLKGGRGARANYVDVMGGGGGGGAPSALFNVMPTSASSPALLSPSSTGFAPEPSFAAQAEESSTANQGADGTSGGPGAPPGPSSGGPVLFNPSAFTSPLAQPSGTASRSHLKPR